MIKQTPGKIYLAEQRGLLETEQLRRYSTFNFGSYVHEHKGPLGSLRAFNDETLAGAHSLDLPTDEPAYLLVLPLTGAVQVGLAPGPTITVGVEEIQLLPVPAGGTVRFTNPYATELINFLHLWLSAGPAAQDASAPVFRFDSSALENRLAEVVAADRANAARPLFSLSLGRFGGRQEALYRVKNEGALFFAFVMAGAFELAGRLLHEKDGLALWAVEEVELEALSNHALVLVMELRN